MDKRGRGSSLHLAGSQQAAAVCSLSGAPLVGVSSLPGWSCSGWRCHWRGSGLHGSAFLSCWSLSFSGVRTTSNPCPIPSVPGTERVFSERTLNQMEDELQEEKEPFFPCRPSSSAQLPGSYQPARCQHACECAGLAPEPDCAVGCQVGGTQLGSGRGRPVTTCPSRHARGPSSVSSAV